MLTWTCSPPSSPIPFEGEESQKIESFEEIIARYDEETPVQQWYGDVSFSGFGFDYSGMAGASSSHPLYLNLILRLTLMMMKKKRKAKKKNVCFNDKGGEISIKACRLNSVCFSFCFVWKN
jgi:hypothetical protein